MDWSLLLAAAEDASSGASSSSLPELPAPLQYSLLGLGFMALASGRFLVPRYVLDRERSRADRMEEENRRLNTLIQEKAIPAIVDATNAVRDSTLLVTQLKQERELERQLADERLRRGNGNAS